MTNMIKAFELNDALIKINPEYNGAVYAIGFNFDHWGRYVIMYNKGFESRVVDTIPKELFESLSVEYLAHMYESVVDRTY